MPDVADNVEQLHPQRTVTSSGGNGQDLHGRLSALEARLDYLATKEDIGEVKKLISDREVSLQRWLIATLLAAMGMLFTAIIKLFFLP